MPNLEFRKSLRADRSSHIVVATREIPLSDFSLPMCNFTISEICVCANLRNSTYFDAIDSVFQHIFETTQTGPVFFGGPPEENMSSLEALPPIMTVHGKRKSKLLNKLVTMTIQQRSRPPSLSLSLSPST